MNVGRRITLNFRNKGWGIWTGVVENVDEEKDTVDIGWDNFTQEQKKEHKVQPRAVVDSWLQEAAEGALNLDFDKKDEKVSQSRNKTRIPELLYSGNNPWSAFHCMIIKGRQLIHDRAAVDEASNEQGWFCVSMLVLRIHAHKYCLPWQRICRGELTASLSRGSSSSTSSFEV